MIDNPKHLQIVQIEAAQLPRSLDDLAASAINTNYAVQAGLVPTRDAIAIEDAKSPYANLIAVRPMGFAFDAARFPGALAWLRAMRTHPVFAADAKRTAAFVSELKTTSVERRKLFWSGERIEWLLARGFHDWFFGEIAAGRALFPRA